VSKDLREATQSKSLFGRDPGTQKTPLLLLDESDHVFDGDGKQDAGFFAAVRSLISESRTPIILTADFHRCQKGTSGSSGGGELPNSTHSPYPFSGQPWPDELCAILRESAEKASRRRTTQQNRKSHKKTASNSSSSKKKSALVSLPWGRLGGRDAALVLACVGLVEGFHFDYAVPGPGPGPGSENGPSNSGETALAAFVRLGGNDIRFLLNSLQLLTADTAATAAAEEGHTFVCRLGAGAACVVSESAEAEFAKLLLASARQFEPDSASAAPLDVWSAADVQLGAISRIAGDMSTTPDSFSGLELRWPCEVALDCAAVAVGVPESLPRLLADGLWHHSRHAGHGGHADCFWCNRVAGADPSPVGLPATVEASSAVYAVRGRRYHSDVRAFCYSRAVSQHLGKKKKRKRRARASSSGSSDDVAVAESAISLLRSFQVDLEHPLAQLDAGSSLAQVFGLLDAPEPELHRPAEWEAFDSI
jgi:hypothetical protein